MAKRILVINVNWLGDVIFSTPALRALREHAPQAHIACIVVAQCEEVLKNNPRINEIIVYDEYGKHRSVLGKLKFLRYLRKKKFDEVYVLHPALRRAMIGFLAGIPRRIGYSTKGRGFLLTDSIVPPEDPMHKIDYFLNLLSAAGVAAVSRECEFFNSSADEKKAVGLLRGAGIADGDVFVVLNPGGNWNMKRWPAVYFSRLGDIIAKEFKSKIVIAGGKKDMLLAKEIAGDMHSLPVVITGMTSLPELAAVMKQARCVVSADSGPMHISAAVGAATIALFGPTAPQLTGPVGKGKIIVLQQNIGCEIPCYNNECAVSRCMAAITPEMVASHLVQFLRL